MTNEELIKLQNVQYQILCEVDRLCKLHNIHYYLAFGTLLGAIRHKGSIPWDNDIDIFMDEYNYRLFLDYAKELSPTYEVVHVGSGKSQYAALSRVCEKNTLLYTLEHGKESAFPIHIDIFVLYKAKYSNRLIQGVKSQLSRFLSVIKLNDYELGWLEEHFRDDFIKHSVISFAKKANKLLKEEQYERIIHRLMTTNNNSDYYITLSDLDKLLPVSFFDGYRTEQYNDKFFEVPVKSEELLKLFYGDFMRIPPEEERFTSKMGQWIVEFRE